MYLTQRFTILVWRRSKRQSGDMGTITLDRTAHLPDTAWRTIRNGHNGARKVHLIYKIARSDKRRGRIFMRNGTGQFRLRPGTIAIAAACIALSGAEALAQAKPDIRIGTGRQAGTYYRMGALIADALVRDGVVKSATAESSSGAIESSRLVDKGTLQIAGMDRFWVQRAAKGVKPYTKVIKLYTIMPMMRAGMFFVVPAESKIKTISDLKGQRVSVGARGSGMANHAVLILGGMGITFKDIKPVYLSFGPGARAVKDGKAATQLQCCVPNGAMTQLSELKKVRIIAMEKDLAKIRAAQPSYGVYTLRKGAFKGHNQDSKVLSILQGWMGSTSMKPEVAYTYAKTVLKHLPAMAKKMPQFKEAIAMLAEVKASNSTAPIEIGAKVHPGSLKALKEAGYLK